MPDAFRLTLAQLNPVVGDVAGNAARAMQAWRAAQAAGYDLAPIRSAMIDLAEQAQR